MIWVLVATGFVLRFTVRDRCRPWNTVYYLTPIPALPIWFLLAGIVGSPGLNWKRDDKASPSRFSPIRVNLLFGLLCVVWTFYSEYGNRGGPTKSDDIRVVFWNVARVQAGTSRLATQLKSWNPDVIALVEADEKYKLKIEDWQIELPEYTVVPTKFGVLVAVKGTAMAYPDVVLSTSSYCQRFDLDVGNAKFTLLVADIASHPLRLRRRPLEALAETVKELNDRPMVIVGDFNTPDDSVWFAGLRTHYREAFRDKGTGYAATWPMPLPVLTLDQVWVNELINVSQCQHGWTICSDHRPVVTDLSTTRRHE